ncbi:hypothetical protein EDD85DRAFT_939413 [Armillaria nabsnona]|nr:hypothetical protein EDD85DRAFT_939413 [Armillaria nabsnona]
MIMGTRKKLVFDCIILECMLVFALCSLSIQGIFSIAGGGGNSWKKCLCVFSPSLLPSRLGWLVLYFSETYGDSVAFREGSSREKGDIAGFWSIERRIGLHQNLRRSKKKDRVALDLSRGISMRSNTVQAIPSMFQPPKASFNTGLAFSHDLR